MTALPTKPRSDSASSSRNDLFNTSWAPEVPPPKPLSFPLAQVAGPSTFPRTKRDLSGLPVSEFGTGMGAGVPHTVLVGSHSASATTTAAPSRTSSFFDTSDTPVPVPPPRSPLATTHPGPPSPLSLSRSSSLRNRPPPLPLDFSISTSSQSRSRGHPRTPPIDSEPLSPLHQSPSLPPIGDWTPPQPPSSDDVTLRLNPRSAFLLGEGRYATVFLGSYKKEDRKGKTKNPFYAYGKTRIPPDEHDASSASELEISKEGDGYLGGSWRLCAAKRMAPDRQSQTMGLREAFFLNRLSATATAATLCPGGGSGRRAVSPLRDGFPSSRSSRPLSPPNGSVYVVKLIAVKEDGPTRTSATANHGRSASEAISDNPKNLVRQRSSTMMNRSRDGVPDDTHLTSLNSYPSLPSLAQAIKAEKSQAAPALTRLVLILEHAPLGTMDRFLRTSPGLVGKALWQRWAVQTTEALQWVHGKGIVHADIKAGNLLLTAGLDVRLSDFGSSLLIHPSHPPTDGVGLGTLPFSPPELVDPDRSFSFPVDIFSLGATLYQCLTGREPFRGCRTIEMMHHVRKGGLWAWEERERLLRIGQEHEESVAPSPYPSAWRAGDYAQGGAGALGVRRGGSLRLPPTSTAATVGIASPVISVDRPTLGRMSSTESLRASEDTSHIDSPPGVKLWGKWISRTPTAGKTDPISLLLAESDEHTAPSGSSRTTTTLRVDTSAISRSTSTSTRPSPSDSTMPSSPISPERPDRTAPTKPKQTGVAYEDGSPAMLFLDGRSEVPDGVRQVLRAMLQSREEARPTADQLRAKWEELDVRIVIDQDETEARL